MVNLPMEEDSQPALTVAIFFKKLLTYIINGRWGEASLGDLIELALVLISHHGDDLLKDPEVEQICINGLLAVLKDGPRPFGNTEEINGCDMVTCGPQRHDEVETPER